MRIAAILTITVAVLLPLTALSSTFERGDRIHITNIHEIQDDLYALGKDVTVDGYIWGDLFAAGQEVTINGKVDGSINVAAETVTHNGSTRQSLRAFASKCRVSGYVGGSGLFAGNEVSVDQSAQIAGDVNAYGDVVTIDGTIEKNLTARGKTIYISGNIEGNVDLEGSQIKISAPAVINGNLTYESENEIEVDESGVTIIGETNWVKPSEEEKNKEATGEINFAWPLSRLLASFLFGIIMVYMFRRYALISFQRLRSEFAKSFAVGILTLFVMSLSIFVLLIALSGMLIGITLGSSYSAILGSFVLVISILLVPITSFLSISGGILFYSGGIVFALLIGSLILVRSKTDERPLTKMKMFLGLLILTLIYAIPFIGFLVCLVAVLSGAGSIVLGIRSCREEMLSEPPATDTPAPPPTPQST